MWSVASHFAASSSSNLCQRLPFDSSFRISLSSFTHSCSSGVCGTESAQLFQRFIAVTRLSFSISFNSQFASHRRVHIFLLPPLLSGYLLSRLQKVAQLPLCKAKDFISSNLRRVSPILPSRRIRIYIANQGCKCNVHHMKANRLHIVGCRISTLKYLQQPPLRCTILIASLSVRH